MIYTEILYIDIIDFSKTFNFPSKSGSISDNLSTYLKKFTMRSINVKLNKACWNTLKFS